MESGKPGADRGSRHELIRVGPAGWTYPDSPGHVYPADVPKSFDGLAFFAEYFDTVEINASFYAPQPPRNYASWVKRVRHNPRFKFTAKLWQRFTHDDRSVVDGRQSTADWTPDDVRAVTEGYTILRDEGLLGAILAQFPWSFKPSAVNCQRLTRLADDFAQFPVVVELRHGGWAQREHALLLKRLGLGFCNIDQPVIGDSLGPTAGATSGVGYVRLHGRRYDTWFEERASAAARYDYLYSAEELEPWVRRIEKIAQAEGVREIYVIANNHFEGKGAANALMIRSMLTGEKVKAPATLFATHRLALDPFAQPGG
ncbi:MAG TPA: DUF72 domain-containing protein [Gemmatimonadales bacterium]|jgi:uncharacterized protein YecE (DUF72 family)